MAISVTCPAKSVESRKGDWMNVHRMKNMKNIALAVTIISFAIGFSDLQENVLFWVGRPTGAIFAIVYFLFVVLEKPFAEFDKENQTPKSAAPKHFTKERTSPALTTAASS